MVSHDTTNTQQHKHCGMIYIYIYLFTLCHKYFISQTLWDDIYIYICFHIMPQTLYITNTLA